MSQRAAAFIVTAVTSVLTCTVACQQSPSQPPPVLVIGIDGAEWKVIEWLWEQDRLPNLRRIADDGIATRIATIHHASPVIWTSVATGVVPRTHGITDFAIPTESGDQPVSSTLRRVPALWNMVSAANLRVATLGWWATWPAETVAGVVVSDRAMTRIDRRVSPEAFLDRWQAIEEDARSRPSPFGGNKATSVQDQAMAKMAVALATEGFDLEMVYFRSVDITSHFVWKYFEPENFGEIEPSEIEAGRRRLADAYEAVDGAIGEILLAAEPGTTVIVLSDHGFHAMESEELRVILDFDAVLLRLGLLQRSNKKVDMSRSQVYTYASPTHTTSKMIRFCLRGRESGGTVAEGDRNVIRRRLEAGLAGVTWIDGTEAFRVRDAKNKERKKGADLVVEVSTEGASEALLVDGQPFEGAVRQMTRLSGTHGKDTDGIFLITGSVIDPTFQPTGISVLDITPTVLYALGLPVAESFDGTARTDLFLPTFQERHPLGTIPSWGEPRTGEGTSSVVDESIVEDLAALGYIE